MKRNIEQNMSNEQHKRQATALLSMPEDENIIDTMRKMIVESNEEMKQLISNQLDNKMTNISSGIIKLSEEMLNYVHVT